MYEAMAENVPATGQPQRIIEIGCRNGEGTVALAKALKAKGVHYGILAFDQNEFAITQAKKIEGYEELNIKFVRKDLDNLEYDKLEKSDYIFILDRDEYISPTTEEIETLQKKCSNLHILTSPANARRNPLYKKWYGRMIDRQTGKACYMPHDFINENYLCDACLNVQKQETDVIMDCEVLGRPTLLAYIVSAGRSETTLPLAITSILNSEVLPDEFILIDDNPPSERINYQEHPMYQYITKMLWQRGIAFRMAFTPGGTGQTVQHQHILKTEGTKFDYILRLDDDCILTPDAIGNMRWKLDIDENEEIGAVAGQVWIPGSNRKQPKWAKGLLSTHEHVTPQWYQLDEDVYPEHLHCSFMYRTNAALASEGYPEGLSPVGHTEETQFSYNIFKTGKKLVVLKNTIMYHLRYPSGGIRNSKATDPYRQYCFKADGEAFSRYRAANGLVVLKDSILCFLSFAKGDALMYSMAMPKIIDYWKERGKKVIVSTDWKELIEEIGEQENVEYITLEEGAMCHFAKNSIYHWMAMVNWQGSFVDGMVEMYTEKYDEGYIHGD
jgi:hypothetical protein